MVLVLLACGCSAGPSSALPTHEGTGTGPAEAAEITGRLAGAADRDGGCLWLETDVGPQAVWWPAGFTARFDPVELLGPTGRILAREGDLIRGGGGYGSHPGMTRCRLDQPEIARLAVIVDVVP